jgi:glycosyltransferase involved in cell wall biosynthesis
MTRWHILTVEYPPARGGVADYTEQLANALVQGGDIVTVWVPAGRGPEHGVPGDVRVEVLPDCFGAASRALLETAWRADPGVALLQYVPTALGSGPTNVAFCRWLFACASASQNHDLDVRVMFHEPYLEFTVRRPWHNATSMLHRRMAKLLIRASSQLYVSTETWLRYLAPLGSLPPVTPLPIPATVPSTAPAQDVRRFRDAFGASHDEVVVGHFGTYGDHVVGELLPAIATIVRRLPTVRIALVGAGSEQFLERVRERVPAARATATGPLNSPDVAAALRACDVALQPYPDGVTTRRTSVMAALANGVPVVTTRGALTESIWAETGAVSLVPAGQPSAIEAATVALALDADVRSALAIRGRRLYEQRFAMERTITALHASAMMRDPAALVAS